MNLFIDSNLKSDENSLYLLSDLQELEHTSLGSDQKGFIKKHFNDKSRNFFSFNMYTYYLCVQFVSKENNPENLEKLRKNGSDLNRFCEKEEIDRIIVIPLSMMDFLTLAYLEGAILSSYRYRKHQRTEENKVLLNDIAVRASDISQDQLKKLSNLEEATRYTKDFVNDPPNTLTATT
ncbi:MAG: hypothetical protein ACOCW7_00380, partial [Bacteroidota bacterium]